MASNFLTDPFNGASAGSSAGGGGGNGGYYSGGGPYHGGAGRDPLLMGINPALTAAEAELAKIRASATGDSVEAAAAASQLIAKMAAFKIQAENATATAAQIAAEYATATSSATAANQQAISGLQALEATLLADAAAANAFAQALSTLVASGLDPTGGLYQGLAASGDLGTAQELAGLTPAQIDYFEALYAGTADTAAQLAAQVTQAAYGEQHAQMAALVAATEAAIGHQDHTIRQLNNKLEKLGGEVREGAKEGVNAMGPQISGAIDGAVRRFAALVKTQGP